MSLSPLHGLLLSVSSSMPSANSTVAASGTGVVFLNGDTCGRWKAAEAFAFLSAVVWLVSAIVVCFEPWYQILATRDLEILTWMIGCLVHFPQRQLHWPSPLEPLCRLNGAASLSRVSSSHVACWVMRQLPRRFLRLDVIGFLYQRASCCVAAFDTCMLDLFYWLNNSHFHHHNHPWLSLSWEILVIDIIDTPVNLLMIMIHAAW